MREMLAGTFLFKSTLLGELFTSGPDIPKLTQKAWGSDSSRGPLSLLGAHNLRDLVCFSGYLTGRALRIFYMINEGLLGL